MSGVVCHSSSVYNTFSFGQSRKYIINSEKIKASLILKLACFESVKSVKKNLPEITKNSEVNNKFKTLLELSKRPIRLTRTFLGY